MTSFNLDDYESIEKKRTDERVLASKECVRVADDAIVEDEQKADDKERNVLHRYRDDDAVHVWRATREASETVAPLIVVTILQQTGLVLSRLRRR